MLDVFVETCDKVDYVDVDKSIVGSSVPSMVI
jgi:hypothetical protein